MVRIVDVPMLMLNRIVRVLMLMALWLYSRFGLSLATAGTLFFWFGVLSALSYFAAGWISERIGLVNTMVFTHLPANLCLALAPFARTWESL
jgi:nitrate/nitrite transporter NarK